MNHTFAPAEALLYLAVADRVYLTDGRTCVKAGNQWMLTDFGSRQEFCDHAEFTRMVRAAEVKLLTKEGCRVFNQRREYTIARCEKCNATMHCCVTTDNKVVGSWCPVCTPDSEGRLIRAAGDVMRAQRINGIAKYKSTLEDQNGYTVGGMIDMVAEELADGSVYVQKVREMYLALLDELEAVLAERSANRVLRARAIINRERGRA